MRWGEGQSPTLGSWGLKVNRLSFSNSPGSLWGWGYWIFGGAEAFPRAVNLVCGIKLSNNSIYKYTALVALQKKTWLQFYKFKVGPFPASCQTFRGWGALPASSSAAPCTSRQAETEANAPTGVPWLRAESVLALEIAFGQPCSLWSPRKFQSAGVRKTRVWTPAPLMTLTWSYLDTEYPHL